MIILGLLSYFTFRVAFPAKGGVGISAVKPKESMETKYPLGYFLFTADSQTNFIRKNNESKADFSLDWEKCRVAFADASVVGITLADFDYHPTHIQVQNLTIVLARKIGTVADGLFFNGAGLFVELIDDRADGSYTLLGLEKLTLCQS